jgi:hypothetical protein
MSNIAKSFEHILLLCRWLSELQRYEEAREYLGAVAKDHATEPKVWEIWTPVCLGLFAQTSAINCLVDAFHGVSNGLILVPNNSLTRALRLLRILFENSHPMIMQVAKGDLKKIPVSVWITVLPQILSRLESRNLVLREIIEQILIGVGTEHLLAVIYPLMLTSSFENTERQRISRQILLKLSEICPALYVKMKTFMAELVRISVTWWQTVVSQIAKAERAYSARRDMDEMLHIMNTITGINYKTPVSFYEIAFIRAYSEDLQVAENAIRGFSQSGADQMSHAAWAISLRSSIRAGLW